MYSRAFRRIDRADVATRLESGVDVEGLAPGADIVVAGGIDGVIDQRLELEGRSGGNPFELEFPDVSRRVLRVDTAVPTEGSVSPRTVIRLPTFNWPLTSPGTTSPTPTGPRQPAATPTRAD